MQPEFSYAPLTPAAFLHRTAHVFPDRIGVVDGDLRFTCRAFHERCLRFAGALRSLGVKPGDRVAVLAGNSHVLLAAHYAVPFAGAVLVALNTRITAADVAYILVHAGATVLVHDDDHAETATQAAAKAASKARLVRAGGGDDALEALIRGNEPLLHPVDDERALLAINYTSGTTAQPKGVMYHHRGAYLQALAMALHMGLTGDSIYLWTLPMFHCNGWCFPWAVTAAAGTHLCLPKLDTRSIWRHLRESGVTHLCAAPTVLTMTAWAPEASPLDRPVRIATGGAPPTPSLLERLAGLGMDVTHLYGLTETYGPSVICDWRSDWNALPIAEQARIKARQGVANVIGERIRVVDDDGADVASDAQTMGEITIRGNNVMLGYYRDDEATRKSCPDGWFRTGDLGVMHPDGYVELRDRAKDIIISGGENISSVEVEQALNSHAAVLEAAIVAGKDEKWGEVPVAFVTLKEGAAATDAELITHVRERLARFKAPKRVVFGPLPKTSTGKVQKNVLRERLRDA
ncbi:MAG TPA: acyl--CoA ligase family protein [Casimicrobiaceae bacterium]|nr:acyl--CoA ligase family protein [Casimicrobiaceae bacterium]